MKTVVMRMALATWALVMFSVVSTWLSGCGGDITRPLPMPDVDASVPDDSGRPVPDASTPEEDASLSLADRYNAAQVACNACLGSDACLVSDTVAARELVETRCCENISVDIAECVTFVDTCINLPECPVPDAGPSS